MTRIAGRGKSSSATLAVYLSLFISIHPCLSVLIVVLFSVKPLLPFPCIPCIPWFPPPRPSASSAVLSSSVSFLVSWRLGGLSFPVHPLLSSVVLPCRMLASKNAPTRLQHAGAKAKSIISN